MSCTYYIYKKDDNEYNVNLSVSDELVIIVDGIDLKDLHTKYEVVETYTEGGDANYYGYGYQNENNGGY